MAISSNDIAFILSGGSSNVNPDASLGGAPSSTSIASGRLFDNVTNNEALEGHTDYRCMYVANNNETDTLYETTIEIISQISNGSTITFGVPTANDVQRLIVASNNAGNPSGGSLILDHNGSDATAAWNSNIGQWAVNIQNALNSLPHLSDVSVSGSHTFSNPYTASFIITFDGNDGNRNHDLIEVTNNLTGSSSFTASVSKLTEGAPINAEAQTVPFETTPPFGITFASTSISIGDLQGGDLFPIWIRRITPSDTPALQNDGIIFRLNGKIF